MRPTPDCARRFIIGAERCILTAYQDSGDVWTIGYGHAGPAVHKGLVWSQAQANAALVADLQVAAGRLDKLLGTAVLTAGQYGALLSFAFNLGANPKWTIWKMVRSGKLAGVPDQIKRFDKARVGGVLKTLPGLDHRRMAEVTLWETGDDAAALAVMRAAPVAPPPSSMTRAADTPPTPPTKPLAKTSLAAKIVTACGGAGALCANYASQAGSAAGQIHDIVAPHVDESPIFGHLAMGLTSVVIASSVIGLFIAHRQKAAAA